MSHFDDILSNTPLALGEYVTLPNLGGDIPVYEGVFSLKGDKSIVNITGRIYYSFCEKIELLFEGKTEESSIELCGKTVDVIVGEQYAGQALVGEVSEISIKGHILFLETNITESCERWRWCYLNGPWIFGGNVRRNRTVSTDRLVFQDGGYEIIMDNKAGYKQQKSHRAISHFCELRHKDGTPITRVDALGEILTFTRFFSFVAGCQYAPFFIEGLMKDRVVYEYHSIGLDNSLISVSSWKPDFKDIDLIPLWFQFRSKYYESDDQNDILNTVVHWYLQANMNSGLLEGAIILGFTGIELLSKEIVGKELSNVEIMKDFVKRLHLDPPVDPEDLAHTRNLLMHYKSENRRHKYNILAYEDKVLRLEALLQILELAILYWLGYEGRYADRMHCGWRGSNAGQVPWSIKP